MGFSKVHKDLNINDKEKVITEKTIDKEFGLSLTKSSTESTRLEDIKDKSLEIRCPACFKTDKTNVVPVIKDEAYVWAFALAIHGGIFFWIPLVLKRMRTYQHHCGNCKHHIWTYDPNP
ncbi:unnamed protein product [Clavelina lepadiformis]|uniref:LITAF domain-containing protein n=1 Tax=Clavelina lepadiformis TaxID=159417 RepID=A0ABP0GG04_CLALP